MLGLKKIKLLVYGFLLGTAGVKVLSSQEAKKVYTQVTAAALRGVDAVTHVATSTKENCEDIAAEAKQCNKRRSEEARQREIEDAKALLEEAVKI